MRAAPLFRSYSCARTRLQGLRAHRILGWAVSPTPVQLVLQCDAFYSAHDYNLTVSSYSALRRFTRLDLIHQTIFSLIINPPNLVL